MFKYQALLALLVAAAYAEPALRRAPSRFLARQEAEVVESADAADPAPPPADAGQPAPYPPAGVTPSIPFDLPTETEAPVPDVVYGVPEEEATPDPTYGPPEETTTTLTAPAAAEGDLVSQNLVQPRQRLALAKQRSLARSQPLLLQAVPAAGAPGVVELVRAEPGVIYILK